MDPLLYFAYGSNLDEQQMRRRCPAALVEGRAVLRDHQLVFRGHSELWKGPVASVERRAGATVPGLLYRLNSLDVAALNREDARSGARQDGHPGDYQRLVLTVHRPSGVAVEAFVSVNADGANGPGVPAAAYVALLQAAYRRLGYDWAEAPEVA
jgi:hypothetical protein